MPTTICARNPTRPKTPYAIATRNMLGDGAASVSHTPSMEATASEVNDAAACSTAGSGEGNLGGRGRDRRSIHATWEKNAIKPPIMVSATSQVNRLPHNKDTNNPLTPV